MNIRRVFVATTVALALFTQLAQGQSQRLAIRAGAKVALRGGGDRAVVKAFCLNQGRNAPSPGSLLPHVLSETDSAIVRVVADAGVRTISLPQAIDEGLLELRSAGGIDLGVEFRSLRPDLEIEVEFPQAAAFGEQVESLRDLPDFQTMMRELNDDRLQHGVLWGTEDARQDALLRVLAESDVSADSYRPDDWSRGIWAIDRDADGLRAIVGQPDDLWTARVRGGDVTYERGWVGSGGHDALSGRLLRGMADANDAVVRGASRDGRTFACVHPVIEEGQRTLRVQLGERAVAVDAGALRRFVYESGEMPGDLRRAIDSLPEGESLVVWRDSLSRQYPEAIADSATALGPIDQVSLAVRLGRELDRPVYLDDDPDLAHRNIDERPMLAPDGIVQLYLHEPSLREIGEGGMVEDVRGALRDSRLRVVDSPFELTESNVLVVSGHKSDQFKEFLDRLAFGGQLDDKLVVVMSCRGKTDASLNSGMLDDWFGDAPRGVLFFDTEVHPQAAQRVLGEISRQLEAQTTESEMQAVIDRAIDAAERDAGEDWLRREIGNLRNHVLQISLAGPTDGREAA